ncbi:MAG: AMP-binding protein [Rhodobacteraceae bacterium]|nr:AMP-binding protein [Paracoccaceae bacterium]
MSDRPPSARPATNGLIADWLAHHARARPDHIALIDLGTGRRFSYRQFFDRVCALAGALAAHGVCAGDRVMVLARNSTDQYEIMFAAWRIGAAFMPVNWRLAPPEIADIVADAEPKIVICDEEFRALTPRGIVTLTRRPGDPASGYERALKDAPPITGFFAVDFDTMNTLLYTSGTTGRPKGVIGTWRMTITALLQSSLSANLTTDSVTLTAAPQFHTAGLNSYTTALFHIGGTVAVMATWTPGACLEHLSDPVLGVTHTLGVPTQFHLMARLPGFDKLEFPTLKIAAVGGAPPTVALLETWAAKGLALTPGYGMTEVFGVTQMRADVVRAKPGAIGWPALYTEVRVADDSNRPCGVGHVGEIQIKSLGVTPGYWRQPELTAAAFVDGRFKTGDLGRFDDDGLLYLVDRKKDMFISGGENVYPVEIENVISKYPGIAQVAVIGVPDPKWGEVGLAAVVATPGSTIDSQDVIDRCRGQIADYKIPKRVEVVDALPLSAQGKVLKTELRQRYGA